MLFLGCCWLQDPSSATGTLFLFSGVLPYLYQKGVQHTTSFHQSINLGQAHTESSSVPCLTDYNARFPCIDEWNTGPTTTTHCPAMNTSLTPLTTSHKSSQLLSTGFSFTQKMLHAVLLNIFHGFPLQLTPWSCSKFLILASSAHSDSFTMTSVAFSVCTCYTPTIWKKQSKTTNIDIFQKWTF